MDKAAAIKKIRQQLTEGDIEAALQLLIEQLEPKRAAMRDLTNRALQAKAQLEKTQRDELQGTVSFENSKVSYNQITQQVIRLVDEWEDPSLAPPPKLPTPRKRFTPKMILVAAILLAFIGIIIWQSIPRGNNEENIAGDVVHAEMECPEFDPGAFGIMVLPFLELQNPEADDSPHRSLAVRLDKFKGEFSGKIKMEVFSKNQPTPSTEQQATQAAEECRAKLAIWGEYVHLSPTQSGTIINTNYKYLSAPGESFEFTMLELDEEAKIEEKPNSSSIPTHGFFVDTVQNYAEIINKATLSEELENQFRLLFGVAVMESGDTEDGIALLERSQPRDSSSILLKEMVLADAYLQKGEKQNAVAAYERVLETHPNYWFAVNNWAMLYYEKGEYDKSLEALDKKLEEDPENINALTLRGSVRMKTAQLKEAGEDLQKAERLSREQEQVDPEQQKYIRKKLDVLESRKTEERKRISNARSALVNAPNDVDALTELAEANRNLGNYTTAKELASRIIRIDEDNLRGIAIKLESADKTNDQAEVNNLTQTIQQLDTSNQKRLFEDRPVIRTIIKRPAIQQ